MPATGRSDSSGWTRSRPRPRSDPGQRAPLLRAMAEKIAPLRLDVRDDAPRRINLLIPTIDLQHLFGGYIAKFNLAGRLAARGLRVRVVTVDPTPPLPSAGAREVESYSGLAGLFDAVEVAFGRETRPLEVSPADAFVATTWWTAHIADAALRAVDGGPLPLPDPGVRAVHVPHGQPRRARARVIRVPA